MENPIDWFSLDKLKYLPATLRARSDEQGFLQNSLSKLQAIQSTVTILHGIITVSQYGQTVKTLIYGIFPLKRNAQTNTYVGVQRFGKESLLV